jgi:5,10-methenyltetrahydromethanopterin hydrogenase
MDEVPARNHAEAHAKAVVDGDMDAVIADFVPDMRDKVPEIAKQLPQPTTDAEVVRFDMDDGDKATVQIRYSNDDTSLTIQTTWEEHDGRPMIVDGKPLDH